MQTPLDLYLIATARRYLPFCPSDVVRAAEAESDDRVRRAILWSERRRNRVVAWVGRVVKKGHDYYLKLEDKIDPVERVLKTMAVAHAFVVHYGPPEDRARAEHDFRRVLKRQRRKHVLWFVIDLVLTTMVIALTPVLAPLPGPNVFFYYPVLRVLSHYRAIRGCIAGLRSDENAFKCLLALRGLEENLRAPRFDRRSVRAMAESLNIGGLEQFLERMG